MISFLAVAQRLLPLELLTCELALFQCYALEDVVVGEMDAARCGEDVAVSLRLTQQFNPLLCVGCHNSVGAFDGFQRDFHHVAIEALQCQRVAGDHVVLDEQVHQCLLIVSAITD